MINIRLIPLTLGILFSVACNQQVNQTHSGSLEVFKRQVDSVIHQQIGENTPGVAVLIAYDGQPLVMKGYGYRDVQRREKITPTTNMRMASVSKQFTALSMLTLVENQKLSLTDPVTNYLPYPIFEGITINNLVRHTSGLPDYYAHFDQNWPKEEVIQNQDVLDWLKTSPPRDFEPGEKWEYSNTAYLMLAMIVEQVSGMEFSTYAKSSLFERMGMKRTQYYNLANPVEIDERANCYGKKGGSFEQVDGFFMNGVMGDGAVYTNLEDYLKYDQILRRDSIFSSEIHELIHQPGEKNLGDADNPVFYAMGWFVDQDLEDSSHSGGWFGTRTYVYRGLKEPITVVVFCNATDLLEPGQVAKDLRGMTEAYLSAQSSSVAPSRD